MTSKRNSDSNSDSDSNIKMDSAFAGMTVR